MREVKSAEDTLPQHLIIVRSAQLLVRLWKQMLEMVLLLVLTFPDRTHWGQAFLARSEVN